MKFTKMHGIGNDYVYVNCFKETVKDPSAVAKFVSDRHFGIGSTVLQHHMFACSLKAFYLAADRLFLFLKLIIFR